MSSFSLSLNGLEKLQVELEASTFLAKLAPRFERALIAINRELETEVHQRYLNPFKLSSTLKTKHVQVGTTTIQGTLHYQGDSSDNLGLYIVRTELGNVPPFPKKAKGIIPYVRVRKGVQELIPFGRYHRASRSSAFKLRGKKVLVQRTSKKKYPIIPIRVFGLTKMAQTVFVNSPQFRVKLDKIIDTALSGL